MKVWTLVRRHPSAALGAALVLFFLLALSIGAELWPHSVDTQSLLRAFSPPTAEHPLGTDHLGRDMLARVLHGGRISLTVGLVSVVLGMLVGVLLGTTAGVFGGIVEMATMRLVDAMLSIPGMVQAVILVAIIGRGTEALIIALAVYSVPIFARIAFTSSRQLMREEYIEAATSIGSSPVRTLITHVIPNIASPVVTIASLRIGSNILIAAALNFFGLGVQPPVPEWGLMIADARGSSWSHPWLLLVPGICLFLVSLAFNLLGDGLQDMLNPRKATQGQPSV